MSAMHRCHRVTDLRNCNGCLDSGNNRMREDHGNGDEVRELRNINISNEGGVAPVDVMTTQEASATPSIRRVQTMESEAQMVGPLICGMVDLLPMVGPTINGRDGGTARAVPGPG